MDPGNDYSELEDHRTADRKYRSGDVREIGDGRKLTGTVTAGCLRLSVCGASSSNACDVKPALQCDA